MAVAVKERDEGEEDGRRGKGKTRKKVSSGNFSLYLCRFGLRIHTNYMNTANYMHANTQFKVVAGRSSPGTCEIKANLL